MSLQKVPPQFITVDEERKEQRLDNFLFAHLKNIPKSRIYQMLRKGEVRVNKGRTSASYKLIQGDIVRIPPFYQEDTEKQVIRLDRFQHLKDAILFEDNYFLILNKPAGIAVHAGSHDPTGIIEAIRLLRPDIEFIELAHRIDKDTSGCLLMAKKRSVLKYLHQLFREGQVKKTYHALTLGNWHLPETTIQASLDKFNWNGAERVVKVSETGKDAITQIKVLEKYAAATYIEAKPETGRMHQIRVHCAMKGHPVAGDLKYGDHSFNQYLQRLSLKRLFLHAHTLEFTYPGYETAICVSVEIPKELQKILQNLNKNNT
jgi:23S rRNA pseudouridine955/2504/2580 synthase